MHEYNFVKENFSISSKNKLFDEIKISSKYLRIFSNSFQNQVRMSIIRINYG